MTRSLSHRTGGLAKRLVVMTRALCLVTVATLPALAQQPAGTKQWATVALGRVEPKSREIRIAALAPARILDVLVRPGDVVFADELMVRLDDAEALVRLEAAEAQAAVREKARDDQTAPRGSAERRRAEDAVVTAERAVAQARAALDAGVVARRGAEAPADTLAEARATLARAQDRLTRARDELERLRGLAVTPAPNRVEAEWIAARADVAIARAALERTRIRAPLAATVLQVGARPGETATPSSDQALVVLGDLSTMRVRAEVDERDIAQVAVGRSVVVRANAFPDREFTGTVAAIGETAGPGGGGSRGPRRQSDIDVVDVLIDLAEPRPLKVGMRVDVYVRLEPAAAATSAK